MSNLKRIDFSSGIRSSEIQSNFEQLDSSSARDRLMSNGWGHIIGMHTQVVSINETMKEFNFSTQGGVFVAKDGSVVKIEHTKYGISFFETTEVAERVIVADGIITVKEFPYEKNGCRLVRKDNIKDHIQVKQNGKLVTLRDINGKNIVAGQPVSGAVEIRYHVAKPRYDIIAVDASKNIKIYKGTETSSRFAYDELGDDVPIAMVSLKPYDLSIAKPEAVIDITQMPEFSPKAISVNEDNIIEFYGKPFLGIREIHLDKPSYPEVGDIWYDNESNNLKIWKLVNGIFNWIAINDSTFSESKNIMSWTEKELPKDMQTFLFGSKRPDMEFVAGRNNLEVYINNTPLMSDQFYEVVGEQVNAEYHNNGIGFKLSKALEVEDGSPLFIEARSTNTVLRKDMPTRIERTSVFIESSVNSMAPGKRVFSTEAKFYKGENQLEVYLNGIKLVNKIDFEELLTDNSESVCKSYLVKRSLSQSDVLEHKVTSNVYAYSHITEILEEFYSKAKKNENDISLISAEFSEIKKTIDEKIESENAINERITSVQEYTHAIEEEFVKSSSETSNRIDNLYNSMSGKVDRAGLETEIFSIVERPAQFSKVFYESAINNIKSSGYLIDMKASGNNLSEKDYVTISVYNGTSSIDLYRGSDFSVIGASGSIKINNPNKIDGAIELCVSGIQFI